MKYTNPLISGMYPDPSICEADGIYYLVNSTFEYFPGVPVFSSCDLVNWKQAGNCLTRESQFNLEGVPCSGGIFAPTIRWHDGTFYMITTCMCSQGLLNFYVTAQNPAEEWSDPVYIDFDGIDPSFYWEQGRTYVQYAGRSEIFQVEIEERTGKILQGPKALTTGCGGRDTEGPHMWKRGDYYFLMLAEGGTREGHMETLMRGKNLWGPFEPSPYNPIISNKDLGRETIQSVGHADWIVGPDQKDYLVTLGTRPVRHKTILGRETMMTPAYWTEDGWLRSQYGYMPMEWETNLTGQQQRKRKIILDMDQGEMPYYMISPRKAHKENYQFQNEKLLIRGNGHGLTNLDVPFWGIRQSELDFCLELEIQCAPEKEENEAGLAMVMTEQYHLSIFCSVRSGKRVIVLRKQISDIVCETVHVPKEKTEEAIQLQIWGNKNKYYFFYGQDLIGSTEQKHLSAECAESPNTGVVGGFYIAGDGKAEVKQFSYCIGDSNGIPMK